MNRPPLTTALAATGIAVLTVLAPAAEAQGDPAARMREAAIAFLDSLDPALREQATFDMKDPERKRWSNLPAALFKREGVSFAEMSTEQKIQAHKLIRSPLSSRGYLKTTGIMRLDEILQELSHTQPRMFGHGLYWIGVFGDPTGNGPWGWQLDGHHLALNFTVADGQVAVTPAFLGADPAEVRRGEYSGWYVLGHEDRLGRELFDALDAPRRAKAVIDAEAPRDVIAGPGRADRLKQPAGLPAVEMTEAQRELLLRLIEEYAHNLEPDLAQRQLDRIRDAGIDKLHFAWAGTEPGKPYYYRVHGPNLLIEFDNSYPPGANEGPVNHIHTVWRDAERDYGEDLLREHYLDSPHHRGPAKEGSPARPDEAGRN